MWVLSSGRNLVPTNARGVECCPAPLEALPCQAMWTCVNAQGWTVPCSPNTSHTLPDPTQSLDTWSCWSLDTGTQSDNAGWAILYHQATFPGGRVLDTLSTSKMGKGPLPPPLLLKTKMTLATSGMGLYGPSFRIFHSNPGGRNGLPLVQMEGQVWEGHTLPMAS